MLLQVPESFLCPWSPAPNRLLEEGRPSPPAQLPSAAISELSEPLEGPLGALRMVAVAARGRGEGPPFWSLSEFHPLTISVG